MNIIFIIKDRVKRIIYPLIGLSVANQPLSIRKTIIVNLRLFGWKGLKIIPVHIYHNVHIYSLGNIKFTCPLKSGLLTIGRLDIKSQGITKFNNRGTIIIGDYVEIGGCTIIDNTGRIELAGYNRISDGTQLLIRNLLTVGIQTGLGFHSFLMDSDDHFTIEIDTKRILNNSKPIHIGSYNWIGCCTFIKKGTVTPDYTIVASTNTLLTKDYSDIPPYSVLAGVPAKVIKTGIRRVRCLEIEQQMKRYFSKHPKEKYFQFGDDTSIEELCNQIDRVF